MVQRVESINPVAFTTMKDMKDKDLLYMGSCLPVMNVRVNDLVYELIGEVSSDSGGSDEELEKYLTSSNCNISDPQGMAKTKQTAQKNQNQNQQPQLSSGGFQIAVRSPRRPPRLGGESSKDSMPSLRRSPRKRGAQKTGFTSSEDDSSDVSSRSKRDRKETGDKDPLIAGKPARQPLPKKNLRKKKAVPGKEIVTKEMVRDWNKMGRIGFKNETARGWLKKTERKRNEQGRVLRQLKPGANSLREIQFYQRCQTFLIPVIPFQRLVREVVDEETMKETALCWQSIALFTLQTASEAYIAGFFHDVNLCAIHRRVVTINRKDIWLAIELRGRDHVGGKSQISDVGVTNLSGTIVSDRTEKKGLIGLIDRTVTAPNIDWNQ